MMTSALLASSMLAQANKPVEVPFTVAETAIIADAIVNGRKVSCMFDTGFSGSFVLSDNVNIGKPSGTMMLRDFVGQFSASTVPIKSLKMGTQVINSDEMEVVQQPGQSYSLSYNTHAVGIMGLQVMRDFVLEINMERQRFILHPRIYDISGKKPDNKKSFLVKMKPKGASSVELGVETKDGGKMTLALDTGNGFYSTTHKDVLESLGMWEKGKKPNFMKTSYVASGPVDSWDIHMEDVTIFGVPVKSSVWNIIDLPSSSVDHDGTVGFGFLKNFNVTIDMFRRRVWMENWTGKVGNELTADAGLQGWYYPEAGRYIVTRVVPGSPAEKAGIKVGDGLLSVDGNELLNLGPRGLSRLLEGEVDSMVKVVTSRDGALQRHELKRQYLINGKLPTPQSPAAASPASIFQ